MIQFFKINKKFINVISELLENVELRFALAETDQQLEKTLNIFLSPVLLKLESPHEIVKTKVREIFLIELLERNTQCLSLIR